MDAFQTPFEIEIEAPDGAAAIDLEHRLLHLMPTAIGHGGRWIVEIPVVRCPAEVEAVVRQWLDDIGEATTAMRVDGRRLQVTGRHAERSTH